MTGTVHGYARVSTKDQHPAMQLDALRRAGVDELHEETASGVKARPVLAGLLAQLTEGDTLIIWKLDRLGRTAHEVILNVDTLQTRGVLVRSLTEGLDTSTITGRAFACILAVLAQLERETTLERVAAGIAISRAEGRHGRPRSYDLAQVRHARDLMQAGTSLRHAARLTGIPRSTLAEALARLPPPSGTPDC